MNSRVEETKLSAEMQQAWEFVEHTGTSVFLTGKAGTGKTTFLRYVREKTSKSCIVTAPTGVAAINAGGVTLHSFFQLPLAPFVPGSRVKTNYRFSKQKLRIIRALDLLIIDEISMVRSDILDAVDDTLRRLRARPEPFGGVQLLLIGDLQQLAPVAKPADQEILHDHYSTPYFFGSQALQRTDYVTIGLRQVFRQQDPAFVNLLNHVRSNSLTQADREILDSLWRPDFNAPDSQGYIRLTTHNRQADAYNRERLDALPGKDITFKATVNGDFPDTSYPTDPELTLKVGAQVMFIKNDSGFESRFYNGKIGRVQLLDSNRVVVRCLDDGLEVEVEPMQWENTRYEVDEETNTITTKVDGVFSQLPLRLAWAITIHKSQGLTFNRAVIDAGQAFAPGQVYVALSRCRTIGGVVLATPLNHHRLLTDSLVKEYISGRMKETNSATALLPQIQSRYHRNLLAELFNFGRIGETLYRLRLFAGDRLGKSGAAIASILSDTEADMQRSITDVATKWRNSLTRYADTDLHSDALRARIENGIAYFLTRLDADVAQPLSVLSQVKPGNKVNATRWKELYEEFNHALKTKRLTLEAMAGKPFTTDTYLKVRREAIFAAEKAPQKNAKKVKVAVKKRQ